MPSGPRPDPTGSGAAERAIASQLRSRANGIGKPLGPDDVEWLNEYDEAHPRPERGGPSMTAARSRKLTHVEEETEALATGEAAAVALASAAVAREEGRRLDYLLQAGADALVKACHLHEKMAAGLLQRAIEDGKTIRMLTSSARDNALALAQHQADTIVREAEAEAEKAGESGEGNLLEGAVAAILAERFPGMLKGAPKK